MINALVHRDLSPQGSATSVQIQMFPDRLAILNAGGLFGSITVDQLGEPGVSARRNQTLMMLLEDTVIPEERRVVCENRGSGIGAILAALRRHEGELVVFGAPLRAALAAAGIASGGED